jgi:hypothetical protein
LSRFESLASARSVRSQLLTLLLDLLAHVRQLCLRLAVTLSLRVLEGAQLRLAGAACFLQLRLLARQGLARGSQRAKGGLSGVSALPGCCGVAER